MSWTLPRFDFLVSYGAASHIGNVRENNEDSWGVEPNTGLFGVADGMGGRAAGEVAAELSVSHAFSRMLAIDAQSVLDRYLSDSSLARRREVFGVLVGAARYAHDVVKAEAKKAPSQRGMASTLDLLLLLGSHGFLAHVGDSRVYLARPATMIQLTSDHTLHGALMAGGVATPSSPPQGVALTNAVGRQGDVRVDEVFVDLSPGDRILLCTDGVYGEAEGESHLRDLAHQGSTQQAAVGLINAALAKRGKDNATAIVIEVGPQRVRRETGDGDRVARDFAFAMNSPLLAGLPQQLAAHALQSAIEVRFAAGRSIPRMDAGDRVGYILLEGSAETPQGWTLGPSALLYPESLAGGGRGPKLCKAIHDVRAYRIRYDDLREVCATSSALAAAVYERLARNLARMLG